MIFPIILCSGDHREDQTWACRRFTAKRRSQFCSFPRSADLRTSRNGRLGDVVNATQGGEVHPNYPHLRPQIEPADGTIFCMHRKM